MFHFVTYATHSERYFPFLIQSAKTNNIPLKVLGYGEKWINFRQKSIAILKYIENLDENDIICVLDGFDTIFVGDIEEIKKSYFELTSGKPSIVFSRDATLLSNIKKWIHFKIFRCSCLSHSISAGMYIGNVSVVKQFWKQYIQNIDLDSDDQRYACNSCDIHSVIVDVDNKLFYNTSEDLRDHEYTIVGKRIISNNQKPSIISVPGQLSFDKDLLIANNFEPLRIERNNVHLVKVYWRFFKLEIVFFLTIIILIIFYYYKKKPL